MIQFRSISAQAELKPILTRQLAVAAPDIAAKLGQNWQHIALEGWG